MIRAAVAQALLVTVAAVSPATAQSTLPTAASSCAPSDGLNYICGPTASEDFALVPGTRWLVASGMNVGEPAHLYLIDSRTQRASSFFPTDKTAMQPDTTLRTGCTGPPNLEKMSTDGINIQAGRNRQHLLYAASHGDRHAIEIFRIDARGQVPKAAWVGCVPMPPGTLANAVVPLTDGGLLISSFYDPGDKEAGHG